MGAVPVDPGNDALYWEGRGGAKIFEDNVLIPGTVSTPAATATDAAKMQSLRVADTWNLDLQAHFNNIGGGANGGDSTTQVDFFDINGDRFPDSITNGGVQYNSGPGPNNGPGSFGARTPVPTMSFGSDNPDLRKTLNVSLQAAAGANRKLINESNGEGETKRVTASASLDGSFDYGVNSTRIDFADVNGDGLVDHVMEEPSSRQVEGPAEPRLRLLRRGVMGRRAVGFEPRPHGDDHNRIAKPRQCPGPGRYRSEPTSRATRTTRTWFACKTPQR